MSKLLQPIVTEKLALLGEKKTQKQYGFVVAKDSNKQELKKLRESTYNVKVRSIRAAIVPPTVRNRFTKAGVISGKTASYKKVYVTLAPNQEIDFYKNV